MMTIPGMNYRKYVILILKSHLKQGHLLLICPRSIVKCWASELEAAGVADKVTLITPDVFIRKTPLTDPATIIVVDELYPDLKARLERFLKDKILLNAIVWIDNPAAQAGA